MSLMTLLNADMAFGERPLLERAQLTIDAGERLGLIGRNGTGKSTLLNVLAGKTPLDGGQVQLREGLRLSLVEQEPELPAANTLLDSLLLRTTTHSASSHNSPADERWHWHCSRTCCYWMSPPIISTSRPSNDWRNFCTRCPRPLSLPMTAPSSTGSPRASSNSTAGCCALTRAISPPTSSARGRSSQPRTRRAVVSRSSGNRKRSGSARASRRAGPATRDGCGVWSSCATNAPRGATGSG